jgi:hypothetical protein
MDNDKFMKWWMDYKWPDIKTYHEHAYQAAMAAFKYRDEEVAELIARAEAAEKEIVELKQQLYTAKLNAAGYHDFSASDRTEISAHNAAIDAVLEYIKAQSLRGTICDEIAYYVMNSDLGEIAKMKR